MAMTSILNLNLNGGMVIEDRK